MLQRSILHIVFLFLLILLSTRIYATDPKIQFIENKGQWDNKILYKAKIQNGYLFIKQNGLEYIFFDPEQFNVGHHKGHSNENSSARLAHPSQVSSNTIDMHAIALEFVNASEDIQIIADQKLDTYYNYYIGADPGNWADHVQAFEEVNFRDIYPGIHMRIYSQYAHLKYDIEVENHANARDIKFSYKGAEDIKLSSNSIHAETSLNTIIENSPFTYQLSGKDTVEVPTRFRLKGDTFSFEFPKGYDHSRTLIIDPLLVFSTYSGSSFDNWGNTATFDSKGNVYSGGTVRQDFVGDRFPVTRGSFQMTFGGIWDIGILKFDSTGSRLIYGTYLGGSGTETPFSIIANNNNELIVLGITGSEDFPTTDNAFSRVFQGGDSVVNALGTYNVINPSNPDGGIRYMGGSDLFIVRLDENGRRLLGSTYLGGSENDGINNAPGMPLSRNYGDEFRGEVNVDQDNNIYIAANTSSEDFPIVNGFQANYGGGTHDGIVAKLTPDLSTIIWSTYIGGTMADAAYGIKIIPDSVSYITGGTMSTDFPVTPEAYDTEFGGDVDGFLAAISNDGSSLLASTYLGTNEYDQSYFLDIDPDRNIYALGQTSGVYPVTDTVYSNPLSGQFIHKLSADLSSSHLSTVVGSGSGIPDISPTAFLVNECGNIFISGWGGRINSRVPKYNGGNTYNLPITAEAYQRVSDGSDFYLMVLDANAEKLLYGTYLGAFTQTGGEHVDGGTCRFDKRGIVYHAICACRDESQFPTTPGVWSNTNESPQGCNNGVFKFDLSALQADFTTDSYEFDNPGVTQGCMPFEVVFLNRSFGGESFEWDFGDGSEKSNQYDSLYHVYPEDGIYTVTLKAIDENTCIKVDIAQKNIDVKKPNFIVPEDRTICQYDPTHLIAGGAVSYTWTPDSALSDPNIADPIVTPDTTMTYYIEMIDANECELFDSVVVTVLPSITSDFVLNKKYDCTGHPSVELLNTSVNSSLHEWSFGDGHSSTEDSTIHTYEKPGNYTVRLNASHEGQCAKMKEEDVYLTDIFVPNIITPNGDEKNDVFEIITDAPVELKIFNRWGKVIYKEKDYNNNWNGNDVPAGTYFYEIKLDDDAFCKGWLQVLK
jgi:gliding motility-associated-like protein